MADIQKVNIVLLAGFNYDNPAGNPRQFDEFCENRVGWLLENDPSMKTRETTFHYLSVTHGTVATSIPVGPDFTLKQFRALETNVQNWITAKNKSFWKYVKNGYSRRAWKDEPGKKPGEIVTQKFRHLTPRDFKKSPGAKHPHFTGPAKGVMSILDAYDYAACLERNSIVEFSIMSHSWEEGPLLINSSEGVVRTNERLQSSEGGIKPFLKRNPNDRDGRAVKDFFVPDKAVENELTTEQVYKLLVFTNDPVKKAEFDKKVRYRPFLKPLAGAFRKEGIFWLWGCYSAKYYEAVILDLLDSAEFRPYFNQVRMVKDFMAVAKVPILPKKLILRNRYFAANGEMQSELNMNNEETELETLMAQLFETHATSYASLFNILFAVTSKQAMAGCSADYQKYSPINTVAAGKNKTPAGKKEDDRPKTSSRYTLMAIATSCQRVLQFHKDFFHKETEPVFGHGIYNHFKRGK